MVRHARLRRGRPSRRRRAAIAPPLVPGGVAAFTVADPFRPSQHRGVNAAASSTSLTFDQYRGTAPSTRSISLSCGRSFDGLTDRSRGCSALGPASTSPSMAHDLKGGFVRRDADQPLEGAFGLGRREIDEGPAEPRSIWKRRLHRRCNQGNPSSASAHRRSLWSLTHSRVVCRSRMCRTGRFIAG